MTGRDTGFFLIALFLHLLYLLYRTFHLGHPPITDKFDILLSAGLLTGLYQLYLKRRWVYRVILKKGERVLLERFFRDGDEAMVEGITLKVRNTAIWIKCKRLTI